MEFFKCHVQTGTIQVASHLPAALNSRTQFYSNYVKLNYCDLAAKLSFTCAGKTKRKTLSEMQDLKGNSPELSSLKITGIKNYRLLKSSSKQTTLI